MQKTEETYNGWTNYETWCVNLWIGNEESSQRYWSSRARHLLSTVEVVRTFTRKEEATFALADELKKQFEEDAPVTTGVWADLQNSALAMVNWYEIAKAMLEA